MRRTILKAAALLFSTGVVISLMIHAGCSQGAARATADPAPPPVATTAAPQPQPTQTQAAQTPPSNAPPPRFMPATKAGPVFVPEPQQQAKPK
jgi:hypothetical protein